jgi:hypothetical protein
MKKHSDKKCYDVVISKLTGKEFIKDDTTYCFDYWYYEKGFLNLFFFVKGKHKENKRHLIQVYNQHYSDYKNTIALIKQVFEIKGE